MINEYICNICGAKIRHIDYPKVGDAIKAMKEHIETKHGLRSEVSR